MMNFKEQLKSSNRQKNAQMQFSQQDKHQKKDPKEKISRQQAISNIITYSEKNSNLIERYNEEFFITYFDRQTIEDLARTIPISAEMKKQEFVKKLTTFIQHGSDQTLFLIISLIGIYKKIRDQTKGENGIKVSDFTSYICEKISSLGAQILIPLKQISGQKLKPDPLKIRNIDLEPPVIVSEIDKQIPQISKSKQKKDKKVDPLKPLSQFFISPSSGLIMTLGSLSSIINIYDIDFEKKKEIYPSCFKVLDKKLAILSFAFSQKQQRIGAIINNIGLAFWDFSDNFRSEKVIQKTNVGTKLFYLELNDQWVTADSDSIKYWDLKEQNVKAKVYEQKSKSINDVCQITHIRALGVGFTMKDESKWVVIYQPIRKQRKSFQQRPSFRQNSQGGYQVEFKRLARINLSPSGCHTIYYNRFTQIIIPLGYKNTVSLYNIDSQSLDVSLLHQLKGHQTIVTCITQIDETDIIFTGDDRGHVIVWTLTDMRCQQLIRLGNWISSIKCIGDMLFYGDTRINMVKLQGINIKVQNKNSKFLVKAEQFYGIFKSYRSERNQIYIFTRKACRILSMLNGKTLKILQLCPQDQEILVVQNYLNGFIIGTSKGDILNYSVDFQLRWKLSSVHQSDTTELKVDKNNKFFLSNGRDSNLFIWAQKTLLDQGPRKSLLNEQENMKEEITFTQLSEKFGLFITCSYSNQLRIWDYQSCKLFHVLQINHEKNIHPIAIKLCQQKPFLVVACSNQVVLLFKFSRKQSIFSFKLIGKIDKKIFSTGPISRIDKKKCTNATLMRGFSIIEKHQSQENKGKTRYSLSNTLHQILRDTEDDFLKTNTSQKVQQVKSAISTLVQQILISAKENDFKLIIAYGKGILIHFDISCLMIQHFSPSSEEKFKKSANVQRPIKQILAKQIYKSQVDRTLFDRKKINFVFLLDESRIVWTQKVHKEAITHLDIFQSEYVSTLCTDGYYKLISLYTGSIICSININFPLPIRWDYRPHKNQEFSQKIHEALLLTDQIFADTSSLTKSQFDALNVRPFLDVICRPKTRAIKQKNLMFKSQINEKLNVQTAVKKTKNKQNQGPSHRSKQVSQSFKIEVLDDEFAPEDIKRVQQHYASLKSYEVYKRVKNFINVRESEVQFPCNNKSVQLNRKKTQIEQRESFIQLLSPNYLPKLLNRDFMNNMTQKLVLSQKYTSKTQLNLTKQDFKKVYETNYSSVVRQGPNQISKSISTNKIILQKLPDHITQKKMQLTAFQFGAKKFSNNQSNVGSLNRSQLQNMMKMTNSSMEMSKANLIKQICDRTEEYKKVHKIRKL